MDLNLSIGKILLLTYIIIASSYCKNLFSKGLKDTIENNRCVQHLILITLIMSLMIIFGNPFNVYITSNENINIILMTLLIYVWFILTTKLDVAWNIGIIILLLIYFLFESKSTNDINLKLNDLNLNSETKIQIINEYVKAQNYLLITIFGITVAGTLLYSSEKQVQYGGGYNLKSFWFN